MKVISQPDISTWKYEFTCYACSSKLCADHTDLKYRISQRFYQDDIRSGGYYSNVDYFYVVCPICSKETGLSPNEQGVNISYLLQQEVKNHYEKSKKDKK